MSAKQGQRMEDYGFKMTWAEFVMLERSYVTKREGKK